LEKQRKEAFEDDTVPVVETLERAFGECSQGKAFFSGDTVRIVDLAFGGFLIGIKVITRSTAQTTCWMKPSSLA
jgi:glutathione S-transferase